MSAIEVVGLTKYYGTLLAVDGISFDVRQGEVFGTTSMEAIVITFERRTGALERLLLAPISTRALLLGKILGGAVFGGMISG